MIYKIFRHTEMADFVAAGRSEGAPIDLADGYVHFSTATQAEETAARHFAGVDGLWLVACDPDSMQAELCWERSRGGALFPHLYRALTRSDVVWARPLLMGPSGHLFPEDMA